VNLLLALVVAFEVATVKVSPPVPLGTSIDINLGTLRNGTFTMTNVTLAECLQFAYDTPSQDQIVGPDWIKSRETRFDIVAKAPAETRTDAVRQMLRTLLAERLHVSLRTEQRPFSFAALVVSKSGIKMTPALAGEVRPGSGTPGRIVGRQMPMAALASLLSRFEGQLVVDKTGLDGRYQLQLEWAGGSNPPPERASLSAALEEQLGLRLEKRREPLDVIVVEKADRVPTDN
jgi:uncharacterized protein (TIGR03435 family)